MRRIFSLLLLAAMTSQAGAQTLLADFEDQTTGSLKINKDYTGSLFTTKPRVMENPAKSGLNTSNYCVGARNVADADWWKNFLLLELQEPVVISDENRVLTMLAYREIQPKEMRIGFNTYQESGQLYEGKLSQDATWERLTIDLGEKFYGQTLRSIQIILSCNWSDPRSGWGEATYCFDDITLGAGEALPNAKVTITPSQTYQTLEDFGASDCWTVNFVGRYFSDTQKQNAARWLFSQQTDSQGNPEGIGLSCWRVNIGAGSAAQGSASNIENETRRAECFLQADGTYDWTQQQGQQWFMQQAKDYGVDHFLLFSISPPVYYTKSGKANTNNQNMSCNLKDDCYDDFAEFLATTAQHFAGQGYPISYIDPVNEPRFDWKSGQEGSPWENANIATLARQLDTSIRSRNLAVKVLVPEASSWDLLYGGSGRAANQVEAFFNKSNTSTYIGDLQTVEHAVAGHSYWTFGNNNDLQNVRQNVWQAASKYNLKVMQTEWSMLDAEPSTSAGFPASYAAATKMDIALYMAKLIHCDLTFGNMSSWHYWTAMDQEKYDQKNRFYLIRINAQGDTGDESYGDIKKGGTLTADKNLWVLGNYSRFIRPGYRRVLTEGADEMNGLLGSSWLSPDGKTVVTVLVNMSRSVRKLDVALDNIKVEGTRVYVTDKDRNLEYDHSLTAPDDLQIPARSVVTVVMQLAQSAGISRNVASKRSDGRTYSLAGRRTKAPAKGVYLQNGRKYIAQ
ncbi:MAG: xylanase [Prevotella sp.]|nr:xylanase [Prevotella sp.]